MAQLIIGILIGLITGLLLKVANVSWIPLLKSTILKKDSEYNKYKLWPFNDFYFCGYCLYQKGKFSKMKHGLTFAADFGDGKKIESYGHMCMRKQLHDV